MAEAVGLDLGGLNGDTLLREVVPMVSCFHYSTSFFGSCNVNIDTSSLNIKSGNLLVIGFIDNSSTTPTPLSNMYWCMTQITARSTTFYYKSYSGSGVYNVPCSWDYKTLHIDFSSWNRGSFTFYLFFDTVERVIRYDLD